MGGYDLVALIFVHEVNDDLTSLVKIIDRQLQESPRRGNKHGLHLVVCDDSPTVKQQLQDMIAREKLTQIVVSTHPAGGPTAYRVAREADLTVVVYGNQQVTANFALRQCDLGDPKAVDILRAIAQVLPK